MSLPFLVEIGTEELPPKALKALHEHFAEGIADGLRDAGLAHEEIHAFAAPRRLAVLVENLELRQADQQIEKLGPNVANAFDAEGKPTKATEGFARSCGISVEQLQRVSTDKGERLVFRSTQEGKFALDLLPGIVSASLEKLPIPKRMRWGAKRAEFVRPVHWLVMLLGKQVVDAEILGIKAGRETRGHRFHANRNFSLANALDYQLTLENDAKVIADFSERRGHIRTQVEQLGKKFGGTAVIDENLLDEVTGLVEWPVALAGNFEARFLAVPQEALISSMKEHQKYFHVVDTNGKLLPHFITISNIESKDPAKVIDGNERVIRPRLSDAAFFYETDLKTTQAQRREKLKTVIFQEKLGTVFDKTERIAWLAEFVARQTGGDQRLAIRAGHLCKADLVSNMVGEFAGMQGIAGSYYARHDGEAEELATAIQEHYLPRFADDELPATKIGIAVALADRFDTLAGIFTIGQLPTGSKDPFGLRRAALGILRIIVEKNIDIDIKLCIDQACENFPNQVKLQAPANIKATILDYVIERFRAWYEDENIPAEVFMAVSAKNLSRPLDINQRVHAVFRFSQLPEAQALAAANKRVSNLLEKNGGKNVAYPLQGQKITSNPTESLSDKSLLAEMDLAQKLFDIEKNVRPLLDAHNYTEALEHLASLRGVVDRFFDDVMVMVDDVAVRNNRLALLSQLRNLFLEVADISLLAPTTK